MEHRTNRRVLVIDDDSSIRATYMDILSPSIDRLEALSALVEPQPHGTASAVDDDFDVVCATQGQEGYEIAKAAKESGQPFAVAFVDMRMPPGWDGLRTARSLRDVDADIYIVIATAHADYDIDEIQQKLHRDVLLMQKPFGREEIFQLARTLCQSWDTRFALAELNRSLENRVSQRTRELEASQQMRKKAEIVARMGSWEWDLKTDLLSVSEEWRAIHGTDDKVRTRADISRLLQATPPFPDTPEAVTGDGVSEHVIHRADNGELRCMAMQGEAVVEDGQLVGVIGYTQDITARKQIEEERERLLMAVEQSGDMFVITDTTPHILYVNKAYETITGFTREEAYGKNPSFLKSGMHDRKFYEQMWQNLQEGESWEGTIINVRKDGSRYSERMTITPVLNAAGACVNYISVSRDITRELEMEELNRQLEEQNRQAQKLESVGTFAGGIAHDFNNILSVVAGNADLASLELAEDHPVQESLHNIKTASARAADLVSKILVFSRQAEEKIEEIYPCTILKDALSLLRAVIPSTIEIQERITSESCRVMADTTQFHQVIMNLVNNARQAIGKEMGWIRITLAEKSMSDAAATGLKLKPGLYVCFSVEDSGCGMDKATMERIFDPFFTTKDVGEGTGLGLATIHGIVHGHGGAIDVTSKPGVGTRFDVYFPAIAHETAAAAPSKQAAVKGGDERILVVDDEAQLVTLNRRMLETAGYAVQGFTDSEKALEVLCGNVAGFDLLITDMTMPRLTGYELAQRIRKEGIAVPILIATGSYESVTTDELLQLAPAALVTKPLSRRNLLATVRKTLDEHGCGELAQDS